MHPYLPGLACVYAYTPSKVLATGLPTILSSPPVQLISMGCPLDIPPSLTRLFQLSCPVHMSNRCPWDVHWTSHPHCPGLSHCPVKSTCPMDVHGMWDILLSHGHPLDIPPSLLVPLSCPVHLNRMSIRV